MKITVFPKVDPAPKDKQKAAKQSLCGEVKEIKTKDDFYTAIQENAWSASIFKNNQRKADNFIEAHFIAFDIDDNISLKEAIARLKLINYKCIVGTSLNHQKDKDGLVADRFRIIFPLQTPISTIADYRATWLSIAGDETGFLYGADQACKDPARFFFPCTDVAYIEGSRKLYPVRFVADVDERIPRRKLSSEGKGRLSTRTKSFLENGAATGSRHYEFITALLDIKAQGYAKEDARDMTFPVMKEIKPEEDVEFQLNHIYDQYNVDFEFRPDREKDE